MDIVAFRTFLAAAATGSFAGAAQRVNASPSSVTERIKQLEHLLGARLFDRDKRGCRLTAAGHKFMDPARQSIRAWEIAQHVVSLPEQYTQSIAIGGQYALWGAMLTDWLASVRENLPDVAFRVTTGASTRLNRDIQDGFLDMVILYDPVFGRGIRSEKLYDDRLILVSGNDDDNWRDHYVRVEWGQTLGAEITSQLNIKPAAGLVLDLGNQSARWLIEQRMCGFMPQRLVQTHLDEGRLRRVGGVPDFDYPAYVCWRRDIEPDLAASIFRSLQNSAVHPEEPG
ncbi:MAG: LysR family transcriptional regulator [Parasphingorhabdus sp.]